jgi:bifunctional oligoribonuclease and PAP phosphatase NrnA
MNNLGNFRDYLVSPKKMVIIPHFKPDADALGSSLGLSIYLRKKGHDVIVLSPSDYPDFLNWMPGNGEVQIYQKNKAEQAGTIILDADTIFCIDFSNLSRLEGLGEFVKNAKGQKVLIDHHLQPESFADYEQWDNKAASTAELVYDLIKDLGDESFVDRDIANCLYAGLMTDTGGFRHSNTDYKQFQVAAELVEKGASPFNVSKLIYDTNSIERLRLIGYVLSNKLQVIPEYRTAYMVLTAEELKRFSSQTGDTEGLVNYGLSIKGVKLSVIISDRRENIKLSFRSLGSFSVNDMARAHFQGGGHRNAAGGQTNLSLEETLKKFLSLLPEYKNELMSQEEIFQ